jgi:ABC-type multidrug transport system ATPase subunit
VFLDEPTSGLDPVATAGLREDLAALAAQEGVTVFLTTHNLNEAERLCAQVGVIRGGRCWRSEARNHSGTPGLRPGRHHRARPNERHRAALRARTDVDRVAQRG